MYLIVTRSFPPEVGGMQNLMWGLCNSLAKHHMIKVFADQHEKSKEYDDNVSFTIERIGGIKLLRKHRKAHLVNEFIKKNKNIKGIIADHWKSLELIKTNKKKICLIHSKEINHEKGTFTNKRFLKIFNNVDHIIANSQYTKELAKISGIKHDKIVVINPGIEPIEDLNQTYLNQAKNLLKNYSPRLITVSRFDKRKNHEKIIMSLRNLKEVYPNIIYICIGYGEEEENIKSLVKQLNLDKNVLFFKDIHQDFKNVLISQSNLFVMPSIKYKKSVEGFGIVFVEAAQYGVPSIGGKDGGAADAIIHDKTGIICDGNNLEDIYSSITKLLENKKYIEFGKEAKISAEKFQWDKIIEEYNKILC